ncbi:MAG: DNA helicase PcrA [Lachnospiraceae bacterium]|jgi:DNA helicase-2/ATP-dependent DNA helicase PcrA|nr:DNA helicase PcrA [Lachnospiraceae bacterium]MCI8995891.1 DNA helicase PcrA [Lachnospiraceae bacterium]MCI9133621.1 DNA helicase PcrA [Lachnospiraceae bacterium]
MGGIYDILNREQQEAVCHTEGPLLILAGAGSGKTRVLTHRVAYLIEEKGVMPWNILAITFTNKAAGEMRERVNRLVKAGADSVWVSTFHAACVRILRRYIDRLGFAGNFSIYDTEDQKSVMKEICKRLEIDTKIYKERALLGLISRAKNELISPQEMELNAQGDYGMRRTAQVYQEYQKQLKKNNALDFDDLLVKTVELFRNCREVLESYQERFRYIMVDEYQDTNTVQFQLIRLLAEKYRNLCVVGDDDQSIYRFRGANIRNILNFEKVFPDTKVIKLEQNYRSTKNILHAANEVIHHNQGRKDKTLWTDNEEGEKLVFRQFMSGYEEAEFIVDDIRKRVRDGQAQYRDHAILYRTNAQSRLFEEKLIFAGIPYRLVGGVNFYARKEIKDVLAYLKTVDNGQDDLAVHRIINVPRRGIGATSLNRASDYAEAYGMSLYDALMQAGQIPGMGRGASKILNFTVLIQRLRAKAEHSSLTELMDAVLTETGYLKELEDEGTEEAQGRIENINELISKMKAYEEGTEEPTLSGFLEEVALVADIDSLEESENYLVLMTLHSAKGLEFPYVYLTGMEEGIFPSYLSIHADDALEELEEERRLCYVGITRAMRFLMLSAARQRMIRGEVQYNNLSRFVKEIPPEYIEEQRKEKIREAPRAAAYAQAKQAFQNKSFAPKQFAVKKAEGLDYTEGDRVRHIKFGDGTVLQIVEGGRDYEVTVEFDRAGVKKMFASFAKLKKL